MKAKKLKAPKPEPVLPKEVSFLGKWELMKIMTIPGFRTEMGVLNIGKDGKRKWTFDMELMGRAIFLNTDLPHPDDPTWKAIYALPLYKVIEGHAQEILKLGVKPLSKTK